MVGDIENKDSRDGPFVICPRDGLERLLTGRVPYLYFDSLLINGEHFRTKLDSQRGLVLTLEPVLK